MKLLQDTGAKLEGLRQLALGQKSRASIRKAHRFGARNHLKRAGNQQWNSCIVSELA